MSDFATLHGAGPTAVASAPGRVNLIGEHTDYNGGFVLPTLIPQKTRVELARRDDNTARIASLSMGLEPATFRVGVETRRHDWLDYVQGVSRTLRAAGHKFAGFDALIISNV